MTAKSNYLYIRNGDFYFDNGVESQRGLLIEGDKIVGFVEESDVPSEAPTLDAANLNVAPGFIDLQVNGAGGLLAGDASSQGDLEIIASALAEQGVTRWAPSILSPSKKDLRVVSFYFSPSSVRSGVAAVHLEGPWFDRSRSGIHQRLPDSDLRITELAAFLSATSHGTVILTLAPELLTWGEQELLAQQKNLVLMLGHSNCSYQEAKNFFRSGGRGVTHMMNGMPGIEARAPGVVGAALEARTAIASIIADGYHVHFSIIKLLKRCFEPQRLFLVSDAMPLLGTQEREGDWFGTRIFNTDGRVLDSDGRLAGSACGLADAVRNCVQNVGIPLDEALRMASEYPARLIGIEDRFGSLRPGYVADITILTNQCRIVATIRGGEIVYSNLKSRIGDP